MISKTMVLPAISALAAAALVAQVYPAAFQLAGSFAAPGSVPEFGEVWQNQRVNGRPYSATMVTHSVQTFANGTKTERTDTGLVYRDSQGRTRHEMQGRADNGRVVLIGWINDPVEGVHYTLIARLERQGGRGGGAPYYTTQKLGPSAETSQSALSPYQSAMVTIPKRKKGGQGGQSGTPPTVTDLGTQTVNGVTAQGVRVVNVIPPGVIGNDREIPVVTERWVSTGLQVLVKSLSSDPRFGTTTFELTNISQTEPDSALFQVPAGYQLRGSKGAKGTGAAVTAWSFYPSGVPGSVKK